MLSSFNYRLLWSNSEVRLLLAILAGMVLLSINSAAFLTGNNLKNVLLNYSFFAIAALGQLLVIITGRIDLSVGSAMGLSGMICALLLANDVNIILATITGIASGAMVGLINSLFVSGFGINSFIVTLGTMQIARGVTVGLTEGDTVTGFPDSFLSLGSSFFLGLPTPLWIAIVLTIIIVLCLKITVFGRNIYAIGVNETAAWLSGVKVKLHLVYVFVISGALAGLAGVLLTAHLGAAVANAAEGYELKVIASVVIGGASLSGGIGSAVGVVLGALLIELVNNALVLLFVPTYWQQTFTGGVIVIAALIDRLRREEK